MKRDRSAIARNLMVGAAFLTMGPCDTASLAADNAAQVAQAAPAIVGDWSPTVPCGPTGDRLRFASTALIVLSGMERATEYEVVIAPEVEGIVAVRVVRVAFDRTGAGTLAPASVIEYRHNAETLQLVRIRMPTSAVLNPNNPPLYRRCQ